MKKRYNKFINEMVFVAWGDMVVGKPTKIVKVLWYIKSFIVFVILNNQRPYPWQNIDTFLSSDNHLKQVSDYNKVSPMLVSKNWNKTNWEGSYSWQEIAVSKGIFNWYYIEYPNGT